MPGETDEYQRVRATFRWAIPDHFNIGVDVCDKWAAIDPDRVALIHEADDACAERITFGELRHESNRAANAMRTLGIERGDRVAILLPQCPQAAVAHIAAYKIGAIVVPLFTLFGRDALEFRLGNSAARLLVTDADGAAKIAPIRDRLPDLGTVLVTGAAVDISPGISSFEASLSCEATSFEPVPTRADDPALIIYTSGTTGKPKGALHAHRTLLGHLPGVEMSHGGRILRDDVFWTPADWAWIGGLLDVLLPALHHGVPVIARRFAKFDAAGAVGLMSRHRVRNVFLPPTALKMLRADWSVWRQLPLYLRTVACGGESLGAEMLAWGLEALGVRINEFYGQTECNMIVSSCGNWFDARPGAMGKPAPGHEVRIVDHEGIEVPAGEVGEIAVSAPDPVMFLGYWNDPHATAEKFAGNLLLTGDQGCVDQDGFIRYIGRKDDVITSAGYRIGPGPIEDCLLGHPAVRMAAVVGAPDPDRTEVVKAFIVLGDGHSPSERLTKELQDRVRTRLAAHEYPRIIRYVDALPVTATGKIIRGALRDSA